MSTVREREVAAFEAMERGQPESDWRENSVAKSYVADDTEIRVTSNTGGQKGQKTARFDLIDWRFLWELATVCGFGAKKYDDDNWRKGYDWRLSYGAMQRHQAQFWNGERNDEESGLHHLAHAAWHCMVLFVFSSLERYAKFDTRPATQEANNDPGKALETALGQDSP